VRQQGTWVKKIFQSLVSVHCHGARRKGIGPGKVAGRERICGQWSTHRRLDSTQCTRGACTVDAWCTHGACAVHARCMRSATCPAPRNIQTPFPPLKLDPNCVPSKARLAAKVGKWGWGHAKTPESGMPKPPSPLLSVFSNRLPLQASHGPPHHQNMSCIWSSRPCRVWMAVPEQTVAFYQPSSHHWDHYY